MALDPSDADNKSFDTVLKVATWVALPGTPDDANSPLGSLFALLGAEVGHHPRILGFLDEPDYKAVLAEWKYKREGDTEARAPTPVVLAQG